MAELPDRAGPSTRLRLRPHRQLRHGSRAHRGRRRRRRVGRGQGGRGQRRIVLDARRLHQRRARTRADRARCPPDQRGRGPHLQRSASRLCSGAGTSVPHPRASWLDGVGDEWCRHGPVGSPRPVARRAGRRPVGWAMPPGHGAVRQRWMGRRRRHWRRARQVRRRRVLGGEDARRRDRRHGRRERGPRRRRPRGARPRCRVDGRCPRNVQRRRGQTLRGWHRGARCALVRGAGERRRSPGHGRSAVRDARRRSPPGRASSPASTSAS